MVVHLLFVLNLAYYIAFKKHIFFHFLVKGTGEIKENNQNLTQYCVSRIVPFSIFLSNDIRIEKLVSNKLN